MTCKLSAIVAVCEDWGIGCEGDAVADEPVAWVIGGGEVYRQFLPYCAEAEVTHDHCVHVVDTYFPDLEADPAWEIAQRSGVATIAAGEGDEGVDYEFVTYRRIEA